MFGVQTIVANATWRSIKPANRNSDLPWRQSRAGIVRVDVIVVHVIGQYRDPTVRRIARRQNVHRAPQAGTRRGEPF